MKPFYTSDLNGMPWRDSFTFGYKRCAWCEDVGRPLRTVKFRDPVFATTDKKEILFPAGVHHFHPACLAEFYALEEKERQKC